MIAVHLPSGTAPTCEFRRRGSGVRRHAAREPRSAILTPSTAGGIADADRWTVSPRATAASMSASSKSLVDLALQCGDARRALGARHRIVRHPLDLGHGRVRELLRKEHGEHRQRLAAALVRT